MTTNEQDKKAAQMMADLAFQDIFRAYETLGKLYKATQSAATKKSVKEAISRLDEGCQRLVHYGEDSERRWEEVRSKWPEKSDWISKGKFF